MFVAIGCALALAACGDANEDRPLTGRRVRGLSPVESSEKAPAPKVVQRFVPPTEMESWTLVNATSRPDRMRVGLERGQHEPVMALVRSAADGVLEARRELSIDSGSVNAVDVVLLADKPVWVQAELVKDGRALASTKSVLFLSSPTAFHFNEPFQWPLPPPTQADALLLRFSGAAGLVGLFSVELHDRPPSSLARGEQVTHLGHGGVTRRGSWVTTVRPMTWRTKLASGSDLRLEYLEPDEARRRGAQPRLRVEVEHESGAKEAAEFALAGGSDEPTAWKHGRVALASLGAGAAQVRATLLGDADAACFVANLALVEPDERTRASVLLVTSDTHRADHVKAFGAGVDVRTPALDQLAATGVLFENCFAPANSTNPSHASLMTGVHTRDVGVLDNATPLTRAAPTLAQAFQALGYRTVSSISIEHLSDRVSGLGSGFDTAMAPYPYGERSAEATVNAALAELDALGDQPVFLWVHVFDAHAPYAPPKDFDRLYYASDRDPFDPAAPDLGIPTEKLAPELHGLRDLEFPRAQYRAEVTYLDTQLKRLFELPRFDSGVIAFLADHGEHLGEHGVYFDHSGLFPGAVHIPLIVRWPQAPAGARSSARVMHTDLGKTLLKIAGADDSAFPGRDLRQRLSATRADQEPRFMISGNFTSAAIETPTHYLIMTLADPGDPRLDMQRTVHQCFLYDLQSDPKCERDVLEQQPQKARELRAQLVDWLVKRRSLGWAGGRLNDPMFLEQLKKLGYVDVQRADDKPLFVDDDCEWCKKMR